MGHLIPPVHREVIPGPSGGFWTGSYREFVDRPLELFTRCQREFGDIVRLRFGPFGFATDVVLVSDPEMCEEVLVHQAAKFQKSVGYRRMKELLGDSLIVAEGEVWKRHHEAVSPGFLIAAINELKPLIARIVRDRLQSVAERTRGDPVDLREVFTDITIGVVCRCLFGVDLGDDAARLREVLPEIQRNIIQRAMLPFDPAPFLLTAAQRRHRARLSIVRKLVALVLEKSRRLSDPPQVARRLFDAATRNELSEADVTSCATTLLLAGHETTANALSWTLYQIGEKPDVCDRLRKEAERAVTVTDQGPQVDYGQLIYTRCVLLESMRLYPPVWFIEREATTDVDLGRFRIRKGTIVAVSPYLLHRDPRSWDDPEAFRPERFADNPDYAAWRPKYLPFGTGRRQCLGDRFATIEMETILAILFHSTTLQMDRCVITPEPDITQRLGDPLIGHIEMRR
jgi:cytochrome P450